MKKIFQLPAFLFLALLFAASCSRELSQEFPNDAGYAIQDIFGDCLGHTVSGNFLAGRTVNPDSNYISLQVHVLAPGRYQINTDVQNGFSFSTTGTFTDTGAVTLRIPALGQPISAGPTSFRITRDTAFCEVIVTVLPSGSAGGSGGGTCNAQVSGSYYKDTALRSTNTVGLSHGYTGTGSFTVTTDTINGYYFNKTINVAAAGAQTIVLDGFGTPAATGTNTFNVRFGDGSSCSFPVTVAAGTGGNPTPGGDYFPLSANSYWSYNDPLGASGDTLARRNTYSTSFSGNAYRGFIEFNNIANPEDTLYYRKDASNTTQMSVDLNDYFFGFNFTFSSGSRGDLPIVKDVLAVGDTWQSAAFSGTSGGVATQVRVVYTCVSVGSLTVNGRTFNNVYEVSATMQVNLGTGWMNSPFGSNLGTQWFAPGVGLVKESHLFPTTPMELRNYQVL